jgi:hypothetical protein
MTLEESIMAFEKKSVDERLKDFWGLKGNSFGLSRSLNFFHIEQLVRDRLVLTHGYHLLNDEMNFAAPPIGADYSLPTAVTTLAHTMCGDRIQQANTRTEYADAVGARFGVKTRKGELKFERFFPAGGGVVDGATLAHVTFGHATDKTIRKRLFEGNDRSYILACFDLQGHVGLCEDDGKIEYGKAAESPFREPRNSCGAIMGMLAHYDSSNTDHQRLMKDLGQANYEYLSKTPIKTSDGITINSVVAASIVAIEGVKQTAYGMIKELSGQDAESQKRTLAHLTGSITENMVGKDDNTIYLNRATVFGGEIHIQGFGTDARKYSGSMTMHKGNERRLQLTYDGKSKDDFPIETLKAPIASKH